MTTNHKPATALPTEADFAVCAHRWIDTDSGRQCRYCGRRYGEIDGPRDPRIADARAEEERRAKAYPRLIAALRNLHAAVQRGDFDNTGPDTQPDSVAASALLRELGEAS